LKYEELLDTKNLHLPKEIVNAQIKSEDILSDASISLEQKQYILEASIEFLEYSFSKNSMSKSEYLALFHKLSKQRAALGLGKTLDIKTPQNPLQSHRAIRVSAGAGAREGEGIGFLGIRPSYHDIEDSSYGFLRGTQIEFANLEFSYSKDDFEVEEATILSIVSLAQRSEFFDSLSWRTKFAWDKNSLDGETNFIATLGAGYSWGNKLAYLYATLDPLFYIEDRFSAALGGTLGLVVDKYEFMSTNFEYTRRYYDTGKNQNLLKIAQSFRVSQNTQVKFKYDYKERELLKQATQEETLRVMLNYYF
jgi:hypothetical protein